MKDKFTEKDFRKRTYKKPSLVKVEFSENDIVTISTPGDDAGEDKFSPLFENTHENVFLD